MWKKTSQAFDPCLFIPSETLSPQHHEENQFAGRLRPLSDNASSRLAQNFFSQTSGPNSIPPLQHAQRSKSIPTTRRSKAFKV